MVSARLETACNYWASLEAVPDISYLPDSDAGPVPCPKQPRTHHYSTTKCSFHHTKAHYREVAARRLQVQRAASPTGRFLSQFVCGRVSDKEQSNFGAHLARLHTEIRSEMALATSNLAEGRRRRGEGRRRGVVRKMGGEKREDRRG